MNRRVKERERKRERERDGESERECEREIGRVFNSYSRNKKMSLTTHST